LQHWNRPEHTKTGDFVAQAGEFATCPSVTRCGLNPGFFSASTEIAKIEKPRRFSHVGEELKQTYTIRIPEQVAMRMEEVARTHGITPTTLIQSLIVRKFKSRESGNSETDTLAEAAVAAKLETLRKSVEQLEQTDSARFEQLRFEIVKTRSALLHSLDQTLSAEVVDQIIEASDQTAREYTAGLASAPASKS
jgi:transposase-like protein